MKKKISVSAIIFFALAVLTAIYTVWALLYVKDYMVENEVAFAGNEHYVLSMYLANGGMYGLFAILFAGIGLIMQRLAPTVELPVLEELSLPTDAIAEDSSSDNSIIGDTVCDEASVAAAVDTSTEAELVKAER